MGHGVRNEFWRQEKVAWTPYSNQNEYLANPVVSSCFVSEKATKCEIETVLGNLLLLQSFIIIKYDPKNHWLINVGFPYISNQLTFFRMDWQI